jgi:hypothetical protein
MLYYIAFNVVYTVERAIYFQRVGVCSFSLFPAGPAAKEIGKKGRKEEKKKESDWAGYCMEHTQRKENPPLGVISQKKNFCCHFHRTINSIRTRMRKTTPTAVTRHYVTCA